MTVEFKALREQAGFVSYDALAVAVLEEWQRHEAGTLLQARSLANRIRELVKSGKAGWWNGRPTARAALCETLDVAPEELGLGQSLAPTRGEQLLWSCEECPQLEPIDLAKERPCELAGWHKSFAHFDSSPSMLGPKRERGHMQGLKFLFHPVDEAHGHAWGVVPQGWGRGLLAASFAVSRGRPQLECETLLDLVEHPEFHAPGQLVCTLERTAQGRDRAAMRRLRQRGDGFIVLAPFRMPTEDERYVSSLPWTERREGTRVNRPELWTSVLQPRPRWRLELLRWAQPRSLREPFDAEALAVWLDKVDPKLEVIRSPADLLSLLSLVLERGRGRVTPRSFEDNAQAFAKLEVARALLSRPNPWLRDTGADLLCALSQARACAPALPLTGALSRAQWASLVADEHLPGRLGDDQPATREALRREAVRQARSARLLRRRAGGFVLGPAWIVRSIANEAITRCVHEQSFELWGELAAQPDRRPSIDAAIGQLDARELAAVLSATLAAAPSLARAAALDSLFLAVAREGIELSAELAKTTLIEVMSSCVVDPGQSIPRLLTRGAKSCPEERLDALIACWEWSMRFPRLVASPILSNLNLGFRWSSEAFSLCFPCYSTPTATALSELLDGWLGAASKESAMGSLGETDFCELSYGRLGERLIEAARPFVARLRDPWPERASPWLLAARLVEAKEHTWITPAALAGLNCHAGVTGWIARALIEHEPREGEGEEDRPALAVALMSAAAGSGQTFPLDGCLNRVVQSQLGHEELRGLIAEHGYRWCLEFGWIQLEPRLRRTVVSMGLERPGDAGPLWSFLLGRGASIFGPDDVPAFELLARSGRAQLSLAGERLWQLDPDAALALARAELDEDCVLGMVCRAAPAEGLQALLPELRAAQERGGPAWLVALLRAQVASGGELARLAFRPAPAGSAEDFD